MTSMHFRMALQRCLLAGLWLAIPLGGGAAHAQAGEAAADAADSPEWIEEIIVTATKRETDLMSTPVAVTALGQDDLNREGVQDMLDLGSLIPNMQVGHSPSDSGVQITVRGVTASNFTEIGDPAVGIHVDGMYSPRPQGGLALMHDVERVEVLRGPQGTLFGRNSTTGTVNIITARPDFEGVSGLMEVEFGRFEHKLARGWFNLPLSDSVALRISFMRDKTDSYIQQEWDRYDLEFDSNFDGDLEDPLDIQADGVPNVDQRRAKAVGDEDAYGNSNRWAHRVSALWQPSDSFKWFLSYDHYQDRGAGNVLLKDCEQAKGTFFACDHPQYYASINVPGRIDMSIITYRSELIWDLPGFTVEYRLAIADQDRYQQYDTDGGFFADPDHPAWGFGHLKRDQARLDRTGRPVLDDNGMPTGRSEFSGATLLPWEDLQQTTSYSNYASTVHELQFKGDSELAGRELRWIAGFFDMQEDNAIRFDQEFPFCCAAPRPFAQTFEQPDRQISSTAFFAQIDYQATEQLNLTFGYRYTSDKKSDNGGMNYITIGEWVQPHRYQNPQDPGYPIWPVDSAAPPTATTPDNFFYGGYARIGVEPVEGCTESITMDCFYQANNLLPTDGTLGADFPSRVNGDSNTTSAKWSKGTWRVGVDYLVNDDLFLYAYVATGFKAGGFGDRVDPDGAAGPEGITFFPYDPEENTTYEVGAKNTMLDGKLDLIANFFYSDYKDMQRTQYTVVGRDAGIGEDPNQPVGPDNPGREIGTLRTVNLAKAEIMGVEFEFDWWDLWPGGHIFGWVSWLDTEMTYTDGSDEWFCLERALLGLTQCPEDSGQSNNAGGTRRPTDFSGNKLPWSPELSLTINIEHNWSLPGGQKISPILTFSWVDEQFFNDNNFDEAPFHSGQKSSTTMNFSLRYEDEERRWGAEAYVYNLTDELVRTYVGGGPGYVRANFAPPRSYGIRVRKEF